MEQWEVAAEQEPAEQSHDEERAGLEVGRAGPAPVGRSSSSGGGGSKHLLREQVESFADLGELTSQNRDTPEEVKRLLGQPAASDSLASAMEHTYKRLLAMAKTLEEMTVSGSSANSCRYAVGG